MTGHVQINRSLGEGWDGAVLWPQGRPGRGLPWGRIEESGKKWSVLGKAAEFQAEGAEEDQGQVGGRAVEKVDAEFRLAFGGPQWTQLWLWSVCQVSHKRRAQHCPAARPRAVYTLGFSAQVRRWLQPGQPPAPSLVLIVGAGRHPAQPLHVSPHSARRPAGAGQRLCQHRCLPR